MMSQLKQAIKKRKTVYAALKMLQILKQSKWNKKYNMRKYPEVLQFPITNNCNSKCVMCNVTSNILHNEMSVEDFSKVINDPIFSNIKAVGINGGEPFLSKNLIPFVRVLVQKKSLQSLNIISNGFMTEVILKNLKTIYGLCRENKKSFHVSFSLDGYQEIHDKVRGIPGAFQKTMRTINEVRNNMHLYCDSYDIGCTVVKENVYHLVELETFARDVGLNIKFRLGIDNERLHNHSLHNSFSVIDDEKTCQAALEFFYGLVLSSKNFYDQYKYWAIFSFLCGERPRRLGCDWRDNGITMDGEGNLYYCAVASPCIGNLKKDCGLDIFFRQENINKKKSILVNKCDDCIHDYSGQLYFKDVLKFIKFKLCHRFWMKSYKRKMM